MKNKKNINRKREAKRAKRNNKKNVNGNSDEPVNTMFYLRHWAKSSGFEKKIQRDMIKLFGRFATREELDRIIFDFVQGVIEENGK